MGLMVKFEVVDNIFESFSLKYFQEKNTLVSQSELTVISDTKSKSVVISVGLNVEMSVHLRPLI